MTDDSLDALARRAVDNLRSLSDSWAEVLSAAGIETWSAEVTPPALTEQSGMTDPRTAANITWTSYPGGISRPDGYPADYPFIPNVEVTVWRGSGDGTAQTFLSWESAEPVDALVGTVVDTLESESWCAVPDDRVPLPVQVGPVGVITAVRWFRRARSWMELTMMYIADDNQVAHGVTLAHRQAE